MNTKIIGADRYVTNLVGIHYTASIQPTVMPSRLYKLTTSPLSGMAADVYVWVFDSSAGAIDSIGPIAVRYVPAGMGDTWDFGEDGCLFNHGIYIATSSTAPGNGGSVRAASAQDTVIIRADIRIT